MEPHHRRALRKSMVELTADLDPLEIMPEMIAREIMNHDDFEKLKSISTRNQQVLEFISTLERRGSTAFHTFLLALQEKRFYEELVKLLKDYEQSLKVQVQAETEKFVNTSNRDDTFEFLDLKLNLGELIEKRDALQLCEHFALSDHVISAVKRSENAGLAVLESLEELRLFTARDISRVLQAATDLSLNDAVSVLQGHKKKMKFPEVGLSLKIYVDKSHLSALPRDGTDFIRNLSNNRNSVFRKERKLQKLFREEFSTFLVGLRNEMIFLRAPNKEGLLKLEGQIYSGELAKKLSPLLLTECGEENLVVSGQLQVSCNEAFLKESKRHPAGEDLTSLAQTYDEEDFPPYEESEEDEMSTAGGEGLRFERLLELIGLKDKFPGKMGLKEFLKVVSFSISHFEMRQILKQK